MGLLFIPLTTLTLRGLPNEELGNATAVYNLIRNIGASVGVALVTTMLSRGGQVHQAYLASHLTPFDRSYQWFVQSVSPLLKMKGLGSVSPELLYGQLVRQATMLSFNEAFQLLSFLMILVLPLTFLMKRRGTSIPPGAP
jgi:DHA2 family multidrug resistance protein